jgi:hypothetical protein
VVADIGAFALAHPPATPFDVPYALEPIEVGSWSPMATTTVCCGSPATARSPCFEHSATSSPPGWTCGAGPSTWPNTGALVKVNRHGTFSVVTGGLNQPTSLEFIKDTAYVVTLGGEIWKIKGVSGLPHRASG